MNAASRTRAGRERSRIKLKCYRDSFRKRNHSTSAGDSRISSVSIASSSSRFERGRLMPSSVWTDCWIGKRDIRRSVFSGPAVCADECLPRFPNYYVFSISSRRERLRNKPNIIRTLSASSAIPLRPETAGFQAPQSPRPSPASSGDQRTPTSAWSG